MLLWDTFSSDTKKIFLIIQTCTKYAFEKSLFKDNKAQYPEGCRGGSVWRLFLSHMAMFIFFKRKSPWIIKQITCWHPSKQEWWCACCTLYFFPDIFYCTGSLGRVDYFHTCFAPFFLFFWLPAFFFFFNSTSSGAKSIFRMLYTQW